MREICFPPNRKARASHSWKPVDGVDTCKDCGVTFLEHTQGFSVKTSTFSVPPSKHHRRKSAVAKRFGQALSGE